MNTFQYIKQYEGGPFTGSKSAAGNWMKYTLHKVELGEVHLQLDVLPEMCNPLNQLHGGYFCINNG